MRNNPDPGSLYIKFILRIATHRSYSPRMLHIYISAITYYYPLNAGYAQGVNSNRLQNHQYGFFHTACAKSIRNRIYDLVKRLYGRARQTRRDNWRVLVPDNRWVVVLLELDQTVTTRWYFLRHSDRLWSAPEIEV